MTEDIAPQGDKEKQIIAVEEDLPSNLFIFPLEQTVVFPDLMLPIVVPPGPLLEIVQRSQAHNDFIGFLVKVNKEAKNPKPRDLAVVGCVARIIRMARIPEGGFTMLVQSLRRMRVKKFLRSENLIAQVEYISDVFEDSDELQALWRNIQRTLGELVEVNTQLPKDLIGGIMSIDSPGKLADMVAAHFPIPIDERQKLLEIINVRDRLEAVYTHLVKEMDLIELGQKIHVQIREKIEESQREFFLREQLRAIRHELGEEKDEKGLNVEVYEEKIREAHMSEDAQARANEQLDRLRLMMPDAAEYNMIRTYLDWLVDLPWSKLSKDNLDLVRAEKILDRDHYGLADIKERIIEFLAVKKLKPNHQGQIICFVGPPGVGKTSLGRSINKALGRNFFGFSLGGMRDEAEIKGHRRTYIGAMPGKIIQGLKRVGTRNPVFILDEIDKLGSDWRGDPSSAMLEVLDPEQNSEFLDHYLDVHFDLSDVMFIATANTTSTIPQALLDRMEVIELAGYIEEEKVEIAKRHLVPKEREAHGLTLKQLQFTEGALRHIIRFYTREAGVRNLDRLLARICRKVAALVAKEKAEKVNVAISKLEDFLGPPRYTDEVISRGQAPGIAVGLAWTQFGGEVLFVESSKMEGRGQLKLTGKLGDVMAESAQIAFSYVRANAEKYKIDPEIFKKCDFHVHFPAGAVPKDGPSAGIAIVTSLVSLLTKTAIPPRLAMTGEVSLVGNVLPVGGIKEKVTAARRAGARDIVLPKSNSKDLMEVPEHVRESLTFHFAEDYADVFRVVFGKRPEKP